METMNNPVLTDILGLVAQARAAYQQTRFKECLALTKSLLQLDPSNAAALQLQSAIRADMQRDLADARMLLEDSRKKTDGQKYRKAAEIILVKALMLDPDNEGAKSLLATARSSSDQIPPVTLPPSTPPAMTSTSVASAMTSPSVAVAIEEPKTVVVPEPVKAAKPEPVIAPMPAPIPQPQVPRFESPVYDYAPPPEHRRHPDEIPFTTGANHVPKPVKAERRPSLTIPIAVVLIAVLGGGFLLVRQRIGSSPSTSAPPLPAPSSSVTPNAPQPQAGSYPLASKTPAPPALPNGPATPNAAQPKPVAAANVPAPSPALPAPAPPAGSRAVAPVGVTTGSLAVNSSISAEIYVGDKYLGSTPTTLQLPVGNQTVEYRHGDLRTVVTHVIKAGETTTANITFDVIVQVNARPWAQVIVDGPQRIPLGQTPLSNVKLPIGSVLVFENPNFPSKSHKIAADDKTIQMVFP